MLDKKSKEIKKRKEELSELEKERKKLFSLKTELNAIKERIEDKKTLISRTKAESESLVKQIEDLEEKLKYDSEKKAGDFVKIFKKNLDSEENNLESLNKKELENEKALSISESEISRHEEIKNNVSKTDICPLCQSKITQEHISHVIGDCNKKIKNAETNLKNAQAQLQKLEQDKKSTIEKIFELKNSIRVCENDLILHNTINEKKNELKSKLDYETILKKEIYELEERKRITESKTETIAQVEEKYKDKMLEIEEISSRTEENIGTTLLYKERELEKIKSIVEQSEEDLEGIGNLIESFSLEIEEKQQILSEKEEQEDKLNERFNKMFSERDSLQKQYQEESLKLSEIQSEIRQFEDQINYLKLGKAKIDGEKEIIEIEMSEYGVVEFVQGSLNVLEERLKKSNETLSGIGSINLRALEVYDEVKKEYVAVKEKADTIEKEKEEILKIIDETDRKKKRTFMKAFNSINELFSRNFSRLFGKGTAYLQLENEDDIFAGGVDIVVKIAKGKYFDVSSLSGGEQTIVALSLLFAIQEYKPYQFYILDEIDAALDKRNSERLSALLNQYTKSGQYVIVTHNDAVILDSQVLYGVSMHEGVSKILSLRVDKAGGEFGLQGGEESLKLS